MENNNLDATWEVIAYEGNVFKSTIMKNMTFSEIVPESNEFVAYQFLKTKDKKHRKLFKCTHEGNCSKVFISASKLFSHMMSHAKEKPYKCSYPGCNVQFGYKGNLKEHLKTCHEGIKRYKCDHCQKTFFRRDNL